jgi:hypothetical protein
MTMTPKEKAAELINKFYQYTPADEELEYDYTIQCALIAVDEVLNQLNHLPTQGYGLE